MKKSSRAFSLLEVLVALTIIAISVTAVMTVLANTQRGMNQDRDLQYSIDFSNRYFGEIYVSEDLKRRLFTDIEIREMGAVRVFPYLPERIVTNLKENVTAVISRRVNRWEPLLIDVGLEITVTGKDKKKVRKDYRFETSFSETYLKKLI